MLNERLLKENFTVSMITQFHWLSNGKKKIILFIRLINTFKNSTALWYTGPYQLLFNFKKYIYFHYHNRMRIFVIFSR